MGLDDPGKKMSKSAASPANYIALLDSPEIASKKIMKAVTDSGSEIKAGAGKPALTNLLNIYSALSGKLVKEIEKEYSGKGYGDFKKGLAAEVNQFLSEFQNKFHALQDEEVEKILKDGAAKARTLAGKKMEQIKIKIGLK